MAPAMILPTRIVEKPWGCTALPAPFTAPKGLRIGEIWFEPPPQLPGLLVKYIFTSENLSVQCHPSDSLTEAMGMGRQGKEECWLVVDAAPGAMLGIGFREEVSKPAMRAAALDGTIEKLLAWHEVKPGDFFYIPAGTVHAIGAGVTLIEVQQNSDITYRLYDYGRPRELHLDEGIAAASGLPYDRAQSCYVERGASAALANGPHFRLDQVAGKPGADVAARYAGPLLVIPRKGAVIVGGEAVNPGQCALASGLEAVQFAADATCLVAQPVI